MCSDVCLMEKAHISDYPSQWSLEGEQSSTLGKRSSGFRESGVQPLVKLVKSNIDFRKDSFNSAIKELESFWYTGWCEWRQAQTSAWKLETNFLFSVVTRFILAFEWKNIHNNNGNLLCLGYIVSSLFVSAQISFYDCNLFPPGVSWVELKGSSNGVGGWQLNGKQ
jgi:hypothetical protein